MPGYKNQHFVPRCMLKPFTLDGQGKAINLFAFQQRKLVQNAPVKNQCARDYLYGEDGSIEHGLAQLEHLYAVALDRVQKRFDVEEDRANLRFFAYLQLRRTEMAIQRLRAAQQNLFMEIFGEEEKVSPPRKYFMAQSLMLCFQTHEIIGDLKARIVENRTKIDFIISDDPAIYTNRYAAQRQNGESFGASSSGLMLGMPITPRLALLCYDGLVYTAPNLEGGRIVLRDSTDVEALNELQCLSAATSLYFSSWDSGGYVQAQFEKHRQHRSDEFAVFKHLVYAGTDANGEIYKEGTKEDAQKAGRSLIQSSFKYPIPSRWLSSLKYRNPIKTFSNGSAIGHVRKKEWLRSSRTQYSPSMFSGSHT